MPEPSTVKLVACIQTLSVCCSGGLSQNGYIGLRLPSHPIPSPPTLTPTRLDAVLFEL